MISKWISPILSFSLPLFLFPLYPKSFSLFFPSFSSFEFSLSVGEFRPNWPLESSCSVQSTPAQVEVLWLFCVLGKPNYLLTVSPLPYNLCSHCSQSGDWDLYVCTPTLYIFLGGCKALFSKKCCCNPAKFCILHVHGNKKVTCSEFYIVYICVLLMQVRVRYMVMVKRNTVYITYSHL